MKQKLIKEGDFEANIAYYCLHKFNMLPSQFLALDRQERAFIVAAIEIKVEEDKKREKQIKKPTRKKR